MRQCETIRLRHNVAIEVRSAKTGRLLRRQRVKNLVVNTGIQRMIDLAKGDATQYWVDAAVGTSSAAVSAGQTALGGEVFRNTLTLSTRSGNAWTLRYFLSSVQANGSSLQEFGEFTDDDVMLARAIYSAINKTSAITVTYIHTITFTAS